MYICEYDAHTRFTVAPMTIIGMGVPIGMILEGSIGVTGVHDWVCLCHSITSTVTSKIDMACVGSRTAEADYV